MKKPRESRAPSARKVPPRTQCIAIALLASEFLRVKKKELDFPTAFSHVPLTLVYLNALFQPQSSHFYSPLHSLPSNAIQNLLPNINHTYPISRTAGLDLYSTENPNPTFLKIRLSSASLLRLYRPALLGREGKGPVWRESQNKKKKQKKTIEISNLRNRISSSLLHTPHLTTL